MRYSDKSIPETEVDPNSPEQKGYKVVKQQKLKGKTYLVRLPSFFYLNTDIFYIFSENGIMKVIKK
jgi:hypothetical protein